MFLVDIATQKNRLLAFNNNDSARGTVTLRVLALLVLLLL